MLPEMMYCKPVGERGRYTWTLASRFGGMLKAAEEAFGPRDKEWTFLGCQIGSDAPTIFYLADIPKTVLSIISPEAANNWCQACYQLAQTAVRFLGPTKGGKAMSVLEMGAAVWFADIYVQSEFGSANTQLDGRYRDSVTAVRELLLLYPDAIKRLRAIEKTFSKITAATFDAAGLELVSNDLRAMLVASFK